MKLINKKTETWNGVKKIRLATDFHAMTEKKWNDYLHSAYTTLLTMPDKTSKDYFEFLEFYNHIVKELKIKTI
tara:strand:+ start:461 stop:679 length:219 start_codon:yes stop_codon:yes gene_type:complete